MLIVSPEFHCSQEILAIVAMLSGRWRLFVSSFDGVRLYTSVPNVWLRPNNQRKEADTAKQMLTVPDGDHLTLLNVFNEYQNSTPCFSPHPCPL
jgi:pre-mRNA-splicing factor ATP-dependent RNA helicase DHX15/PRP43